jgi:nucleoside transporter
MQLIYLLNSKYKRKTMNQGVRWRLSVMMFLQYVVWGMWAPVLAAYLQRPVSQEGLGFSGIEIGWVFALLPMGCMIAPFFGGQLADRTVATEKLLGVLHLLGGIFLCLLATVKSYNSFLLLMGAWSFVYAPTLALTNSLTFHHLPDAEKKFGLVRVFGTFGWIAAGLLLTSTRKIFPNGLPGLGGEDSLWIGGFASFVLGLFCFALPHTPPAKKGGSPWAFLGALKLLRDPSFLLFIIIAFVVSTELQFYYVLTAPFLESIGVAKDNVPAVMTIAQIAEIGTMLSLPWMLSKWGVRKTMALGIFTWPIRYAIFALGQPKPLVIAALTLHGICYVCFFVVCYIYVNSVATPDIRASAQALITFVTLGIGMALGSVFSGFIKDYFTTGTGDAAVANYTKIFLVPCVLTIICALVFFIGFRDKRAESPAAA